jgi:hypothetical protein
MLTEVWWHSLTARASITQMVMLSLGIIAMTYGITSFLQINEEEDGESVLP